MANTPEPEPIEPEPVDQVSENESEHASDGTHTDTESVTDPVEEIEEEDPTTSEQQEEMDRIQALEMETELENLKKQRMELESALIQKKETRQNMEQAFLAQHAELPYSTTSEGNLEAQIEALQTARDQAEETERLEQLRIERLQYLQTLPEIQELRATAAGAIDLAGFHDGLRLVFNGNLDTPEGRLNVNAKTSTGETPLHLVIRGCSQANAPLPNADDAMAMHERRTKTTLLLCMGADLHAKDDNGRTPLHGLVQDPCQDERLVHLLLAHGADPFAEDNEGKTPVQIGDAFAIRAILTFDDGGFQSRLAESWSPDAFANMDLFTKDPQGASQIMHDLYQRLA